MSNLGDWSMGGSSGGWAGSIAVYSPGSVNPGQGSA